MEAVETRQRDWGKHKRSVLLLLEAADLSRRRNWFIPQSYPQCGGYGLGLPW